MAKSRKSKIERFAIWFPDGNIQIYHGRKVIRDVTSRYFEYGAVFISYSITRKEEREILRNHCRLENRAI